MTLLTTKQVAAYLNVSPGTVWNWHSQGKLPGSKVFGLRFKKEDIDALIEKDMKKHNG
jgi:excisionase family DNA binding protein